MTTATTQAPELIGAEPPVIARDRMTQAWVAAATVSWWGDAVFTIALAWTAVHLLSPGWAGLVVAIGTVPQALLMLVGGAVADRFDTRRVMVAGELGRVGVLLVGAALWSGGLHSGGVLAAVALAFGTAAGLTNPARATLVRQLVAGDDLGTVIGWSQIGSRAATLAGAPVGALVVVHGGIVAAMLLDAVTFAAVALVLVLVIRPRYRLPRAAEEGWRAAIGEGLAYLRRTPVARTLVVSLLALNIFVVPATDIGVPLRVTQAGWSSAWLGIAEAMMAVGAIAGSVVAIRWRGTRRTTRAFWLLVLQGIAIAAVGAPVRWLLVAGMVVIGLTAGAASVWVSAAFQQAIAPSHLGRISSMSQIGDQVLLPVMTPAFGLLAAGLSIGAAAAVFGLAMAALCLAFALQPAIRSLP